jgi:hypothetical protein
MEPFLEKKNCLMNGVTYYPANLRPTLKPRRYQADREQLTHPASKPLEPIGEENMVRKLTHYLKAEHFLIYAPGTPPTALMTKARMRLATDGNTEILERFWHPELIGQPTDIAPPLLVYADLMRPPMGAT